jgi:peptide/nickel transport system permease protein
MYFVPGDPVQIALGDSATQAQIEEARERMGLNQPFIVRMGNYLYQLFFRFSFGTSYLYGTDVGTELLARFPRTLTLALMSVSLTVLLGVPLGIYSAINSNKIQDRMTMFITLLLNSMPGFWLALMLVLLFSLKLGLLPSFGATSIVHYILPTISNGLGQLAGLARQTRSSMLEVIRADYVVTARSKGLSERKVIWGHALPNALIPIITICGARFGILLGGTTITETVFTIPGIGLYMISGINSRDYNIVQGAMIYIAFTFSIMMLITDLIYAFIDPRIKARYVGSKKMKQTQPAKAAA